MLEKLTTYAIPGWFNAYFFITAAFSIEPQNIQTLSSYPVILLLYAIVYCGNNERESFHFNPLCLL